MIESWMFEDPLAKMIAWGILGSMFLGFVGMMFLAIVVCPIVDAIQTRHFLRRLPAERREEFNKILRG